MVLAWKYNDLEFKYLDKDIIPELVKGLNEPEVEKYLWFAPVTIETFEGYALPIISAQQEAVNKGEYPRDVIFAIYANGDLIGICGLNQITDAHNCGLIGYQLKRSAWGNGYATLSLKFLIYYAAEYHNFRKLFGDCVTENIASVKVMEKCGFTYEGTIKEKYDLGGTLHDNSWFGLRMCEAEICSDIQQRD